METYKSDFMYSKVAFLLCSKEGNNNEVRVHSRLTYHDTYGILQALADPTYFIIDNEKDAEFELKELVKFLKEEEQYPKPKYKAFIARVEISYSACYFDPITVIRKDEQHV